jgi:Ca2+-binding EF-hand superfamily protein
MLALKACAECPFYLLREGMSGIMRLALSILLILSGGKFLVQEETASRQQAGQASQPSSSTARWDDPVAMFLRLFDLLDADGDGVAPLADIFESLDLKRAEARQVKRVRALDANSDGKVTRAEAVAGVQAEIEYQTRRRLNNDADGDGQLTSLEYALSVPDPEGKADSSGLTPLQQSAFKADDLDGNGRITRIEIEARVARGYAGSYWALLMALRARRADIDRDGLIDEREFALIIGKSAGEQLSEDDRKRLAVTGASDGRLTVQNLQVFFIRMNETERGEAEKRITAFEERLNSKQRPEGKNDR